MVTELKKLPEGVTSFEANGKRFLVHTSLTLDGYIILEDLSLSMAAGTTPRDLLKGLRKAYAAQNAGTLADASRLMYDAIGLGARLQSGEPPVWLEALTLFVRPEGADLTTWDRTEALLWIEDWTAEGIATDSLFTLASGCSEAFAAAFLPPFLTSSGNTGEEAESESDQPLAKG